MIEEGKRNSGKSRGFTHSYRHLITPKSLYFSHSLPYSYHGKPFKCFGFFSLPDMTSTVSVKRLHILRLLLERRWFFGRRNRPLSLLPRSCVLAETGESEKQTFDSISKPQLPNNL